MDSRGAKNTNTDKAVSERLSAARTYPDSAANSAELSTSPYRTLQLTPLQRLTAGGLEVRPNVRRHNIHKAAAEKHISAIKLVADPREMYRQMRCAHVESMDAVAALKKAGFLTQATIDDAENVVKELLSKCFEAPAQSAVWSKMDIPDKVETRMTLERTLNDAWAACLPRKYIFAPNLTLLGTNDYFLVRGIPLVQDSFNGQGSPIREAGQELVSDLISGMRKSAESRVRKPSPLPPFKHSQDEARMAEEIASCSNLSEIAPTSGIEYKLDFKSNELGRSIMVCPHKLAHVAILRATVLDYMVAKYMPLFD